MFVLLFSLFLLATISIQSSKLSNSIKYENDDDTVANSLVDELEEDELATAMDIREQTAHLNRELRNERYAKFRQSIDHEAPVPIKDRPKKSHPDDPPIQRSVGGSRRNVQRQKKHVDTRLEEHRKRLRLKRFRSEYSRGRRGGSTKGSRVDISARSKRTRDNNNRGPAPILTNDKSGKDEL